MLKKIFICLCLSILLATPAFAQDKNFVSIVNPVRGSDFWVQKQTPQTAVLGEMEILKNQNVDATWLIRFDALSDEKIINTLISSTDEKGLFLEVTPTWANQAKVEYHKSDSWHSAGSAFLTGYEPWEREKLIDVSFDKFKKIFGYYPLSVGAWWIDSYSLGYMQKKYNIISALIVSDQYSTDNYQIWGQYFSTPYYPSKNNALHPAQTLEHKLDMVITQWAPRDPVNSYGNGVEESTFSVQPNDYIDFHNLDINYFAKIVDIYTKQKFVSFAHLVVGLENSYAWDKYSNEYAKQIDLIRKKVDASEIKVLSLKDFANWYKVAFPNLSPAQLIVADDPLGSYKKTVWFMNPYYRIGWFFNQDGSTIRDIRQYLDGEEELCLKKRCSSVNFATSATRVLDDVSFGHQWIIDQGKISDFTVEKNEDKFVISYKNEAGNLRKIGLLPKDISIDGQNFSIDGAILNATKKENVIYQSVGNKEGELRWSVISVLIKTSVFLLFLLMAVICPGFILTKKLLQDSPTLLKLFISSIVGFVALTMIFYIFSLFKLQSLIFIYVLLCLLLSIRLRIYHLISDFPKIRSLANLPLIVIILIGVIFQIIPTFRSGLNFGYGMGFWGPNTHDGIWHVALINQLIKSVPTENPIFANTVLKNYHFFYDLLIAATNFLTKIPILDLIFRYYPVIFSILLSIGTYYLVLNLVRRIGIIRAKTAAFISLYFVYFAGSFGWIVDYIKNRSLGGESAFWANQSVSFNLNPPFAISLLIIIALINLIQYINDKFSLSRIFIVVLLGGTLIGFKSYAAILFLITLSFITLINFFKKNFLYIYFLLPCLVLSFIIFLSNFQFNQQLVIFSPFWFIHSMVDSPDRVGWIRLTLSRMVGIETKNWSKFILAEVIGLLIFIVGNLGVRFISLLSIFRIKKISKNTDSLFLLIFSFLSFLIPILFIQSGNPWNTIQFSYYGLYVASAVSGVVLSSLVFSLPKLVAIITIVILILLAPINSITTATYYIHPNPHAKISTQELTALEFLSKQPSGIVLTYPYNDKLKQRLAEPYPLYAYDSTAYVAALSKKSVFIEDEPQNQILLNSYTKRLVAVKNFFQYNNLDRRKFLDQNHIRYIYIPKIINTDLEEKLLGLKNIFENEEIIMYRVE